MATEAPKPKSKAGRPKKPPTPPMLGIAERSGPWGRCVIVLGGLVVNGKRYDPQEGADNLADMFVYCMRTPETDPADKMIAEAVPLMERAIAKAEGKAGEDLPALETAMTAAEDGANGSH